MCKVGSLLSTNEKIYKRREPGINLSTDYMTDEEINSLSGEVTIYYVEDSKSNKELKF